MKIWEDEDSRLAFEAVAKRADQPDREGWVYTKAALEGIVESFDEGRGPTHGGIYDVECSEFDYQPEAAFEICETRLDEDGNLVISGKVLDSAVGARLAEHLRTCTSPHDRVTVSIAGFAQTSTSTGRQVIESFTATRVTVIPESQSILPPRGTSSPVSSPMKNLWRELRRAWRKPRLDTKNQTLVALAAIGLLLVALLVLLLGCGGGTEPAATATAGMTLSCDLPDGTGTLVATHVVTSTEGWYVMGVVTITLDSGGVFTMTGPMNIAPEASCVVTD